MSQTSQKNACKMCGKLLVLSGLNLSRVLFIAVVPFWYSGGKTQRLFDNDLHDFFEWGNGHVFRKNRSYINPVFIF